MLKWIKEEEEEEEEEEKTPRPGISAICCRCLILLPHWYDTLCGIHDTL
jgi:hypothetical protein